MTLAQAVAATALPLQLTGGRLAGSGAEWLRQRGAESAAVLVGEAHGVAEIPPLVAALLADLRPLGFGHLVIETGPVTAELVESLLRQEGDPYPGLVALHPFGVPFYGWSSEVDLLPSLGTAAEGGWLLYDFETVRARLHEGRLTSDDAELEEAVWNLDAAIVIPRATPATPLDIAAARPAADDDPS